MTAKEYLSRAKDISNMIKAREVMIKEGYSSSEYKGINYDAVGSHGGGSNSTESAYIRAMDFDERISKEIAELKTELNAIRSVILAVGNGIQELILTLKFFGCKDFDEIAVEVNYSRCQVIRIYNAALAKVAEILKDDTK